MQWGITEMSHTKREFLIIDGLDMVAGVVLASPFFMVLATPIFGLN